MSKLSTIVDCLIKSRQDYKNLNNEAKEYYFFIINRFLSKKYPIEAQKFNIKDLDKSLALDMWYLFLGKELQSKSLDYSFYRWFWSKSPKIKRNDWEVEDNNFLLKKLRIKQEDLDFLIKFYPEEITEELQYFKNLENQQQILK